MPDKPPLPFAQVQAAMDAMTGKAMQTPDQVVAIAIVDSTGNLLAYAQTGALRLLAQWGAARSGEPGPMTCTVSPTLRSHR